MTKSKNSTNRFYGCHVSSAGGLQNALRAAEALQINTIQLHPSPPQRWNIAQFREGIENEFLHMRAASGVKRVFFHGIYLINLATPLKDNLKKAELSLIHYLDLISRIRGDGVIFHVGSMKDEENEARGLRHAADAIKRILENSPSDSRLLLEVAAGSGKIIGDRLEELQEIVSQIGMPSRLGFALDTQHLWASGYNIAEDLDGFVKLVSRTFGLDRVWAIHLNDSKTDCGSRKDRHENLGQGLIGNTALRDFFRHPGFAHIPFILETPNMKTLETAMIDVDILNRWANEGPFKFRTRD